MINYRLQAKKALAVWWRDHMRPAIDAEVARLVDCGLSEMQARELVMEQLNEAAAGLRGLTGAKRCG